MTLRSSASRTYPSIEDITKRRGGALRPNHLLILAALAESPTPLRSSTLAGRARLLGGECRSACQWLRKQGYVTCQFKRVKQKFRDACGFKRIAVWSLTDKGRVARFVDCLDNYAG